MSKFCSGPATSTFSSLTASGSSSDRQSTTWWIESRASDPSASWRGSNARHKFRSSSSISPTHTSFSRPFTRRISRTWLTILARTRDALSISDKKTICTSTSSRSSTSVISRIQSNEHRCTRLCRRPRAEQVAISCSVRLTRPTTTMHTIASN